MKVTWILIIVLGMVGCATTKVDWKKAENSHTIEAYQNFVKMHPKSGYAKAAKSKIKPLVVELIKKLKEITIIMEDSKNSFPNLNISEIKKSVSDSLIKKGYIINKFDTPNKLIVKRSVLQACSGTSSHWYPTISEEVELIFSHKKYGKLFSNSYARKAIGIKTSFCSDPGFSSIGGGRMYFTPQAGSPKYSHYITYNWNELYQFMEEDFSSLLEEMPPLHIYDNTKFLY